MVANTSSVDPRSCSARIAIIWSSVNLDFVIVRLLSDGLSYQTREDSGLRRKRSRFSEERIVAVLKEHELGAKAADLARKHGISETTLYNWKAEYGGLTVSEARRLKSLEDENSKLKRLLADAMLDNAESVALKKCMTCPARARFVMVPTTAVRLNVSGLSRAGCCSQAMMRSARMVLR
jgi:putative transposase